MLVSLTNHGENGRRFQHDAAQVLLAGITQIPESVVVAKLDPRMKPGVPGINLGLSYKITTGVFDLYVPLQSGTQDLTIIV